MPFGLTNAPSTFQALMNEILRSYLRKFALVFFYNILIYSRSKEDHGTHVRAVLSLLAENKLLINKKRCSFGQSQLEYLGHIISGEGVAADPQKLEVMRSWPTPSDVKSLRGFLGLTGYYKRFVQNYGRIARPLYNLLKKDGFKWNEEAEEATRKLKIAMAEIPILTISDFTQPFTVETDASNKGLGVVLMQQGRPLAFLSQSLSNRAQKKSVYERELMAIVLAI